MRKKKVWVAGHGGLVGTSIVNRLKSEDCRILTVSRQDLDLRCQKETMNWVADNRPDVIVIAAATVGGIRANNDYPATFIYDNIMITTNIIESAYRAQTEKLVFLGSNCVYPRDAPQPLCEDSLLTGQLEPTNQWYALAKIAGIKLCEAYRRQFGCDFISVMPASLYGPGDNFSVDGGHVLPALIRRFHEAKEAHAPEITIWGTGNPLREFMYIDDLADAIIFVIKHYSKSTHLNIGSGIEVSIKELSRMIADIVEYSGKIVFDESKPDGMPRKILDTKQLHTLGWNALTPFETGLRTTYKWYTSQLASNAPIRGVDKDFLQEP